MQVKTTDTFVGKQKNFNNSIKIKIIAILRECIAYKKYGKHIFRLVTYILLLDLSFVFLFPFLYMLATSIKTNTDIYDITVNWIPRTIRLKNYILAFETLEYTKYIKNTLLVTVVATIGHVLSCSFIGFGFARYNFPGKKLMLLVVIIALIVPIQTIIIPLYMLYANLQWLNSYLPVLVPTFFGFGLKGALFIFIFRQFYLGFPKELEDAARIDGCGFLKAYWSIVLPVARSAFLVTMVLSLVWHWNDFYEPAIYASLDPSYDLLPARIGALITMVNKPPDINSLSEMSELTRTANEENIINNAVLMAGIFLVILPLIISFAFLQKKFMQGVERTGLIE